MAWPGLVRYMLTASGNCNSPQIEKQIDASFGMKPPALLKTTVPFLWVSAVNTSSKRSLASWKDFPRGTDTAAIFQPLLPS